MTPSRIPVGWRLARYGDVLSEKDERAGDKVDLPVLSVTKTRGLMLASERFGKVMHGRDLARYRIARRGQIVADPMLLWDGSIGLQEVVGAGLVSPDYRVYQPTADVIPQFMGMLVRSPGQIVHYQAGAKGTNVRRNRISRSDFLNIPLLLPPLGKQQRIVAILASIDDAIRSAQAIVAQLQAVAKAITTAALTHGTPGRHTKFVDTELGNIPESWAIRPLRRLVREPIRNGQSPVCPKEETGRWILHVGAVTFDGYNPLAVKPAPVVGPNVTVPALSPGDILVSRSNTRERVGLAGIYNGSPFPCSYPDLLMRVRVGEEIMPEFLEAVLLSERGRCYFSTSARGTSETMVKINRATLEEFPIQLPPIDEQKNIVTWLRLHAERRKSEAEYLSALGVMRAALMSSLFCGGLP